MSKNRNTSITAASNVTRQQLYGYTTPGDGRDEVFTARLAEDEVASAAEAIERINPGNKDIITPAISVTQLDALAA